MLDLTSTRNTELADLLRLGTRQSVVYRPMENLVVSGEAIGGAYFIRSGWACCHRLSGNGRRQILQFLLREDLVGFLPLMMSVVGAQWNEGLRPLRSPITVSALTPVKAVIVDGQHAAGMWQARPDLCLALSCEITTRTFESVASRFATLGQGSARERMALLWLELWQRQRAVGLADTHGFPLPINQPAVADALGLTPVHVSRTLRWFETEGIVTHIREAPRRIRVQDADRLRRIAASFERY